VNTRCTGRQHGELVWPRRVPHRDARHEPVALRLGERVGALHLDGVLRRDDGERLIEDVRRAVGRDLPFLHALEERRLGLRARPVDLVADDDVREDRASLEFESTTRLVEDRDSRDVARKEVWGELDAAHGAVDRPGERLREHGLTDAGHVFDEEMSFSEQHGERGRDRFALAGDDRLDIRHDLGGTRADLVDAHRTGRLTCAAHGDRRLAHAVIAAWR
jgi:hypothetical protein